MRRAHRFDFSLAGPTVAAVTAVAAAPAHAITFTPFPIASQVSTSGAFGGVNGDDGNGDVP